LTKKSLLTYLILKSDFSQAPAPNFFQFSHAFSKICCHFVPKRRSLPAGNSKKEILLKWSISENAEKFDVGILEIFHDFGYNAQDR